MTNEEKARQLAIQSTKYVDDNGKEVYNAFVEAALLEMAEWEKQQMIDKACEWWENKLTYPTMSQVEIDWMQTKIVSFRKAMEE